MYYKTPVNNEANLEERIYNSFFADRNESVIFEMVRRNLRRTQPYINEEGSHIEHKLELFFVNSIKL